MVSDRKSFQMHASSGDQIQQVSTAGSHPDELSPKILNTVIPLG